MGGRKRLFSKQWLTRYYVYEVRFRPSWNEVVIDVTNTLFYSYQQNAVTIIQNLFHDLKHTDEEGKGTVNVLVATQHFESFAFEYAKIHFKKNQSVIIMEENYGTSIYPVTISTQGRVKSLSEIFSHSTNWEDYLDESIAFMDGREPHRTSLEAGHMTNNLLDLTKHH